MTSHELAKKLLSLPDKEITIVGKVDGPYTEDLEIKSQPWEDLLGNIRIQVGEPTQTVERSGAW